MSSGAPACCHARAQRSSTRQRRMQGVRGSARRVRQRVATARGRSSARHRVRQRAAARCGSVQGAAREPSASFAGRKEQLRRARRAHGSGSTRAHRQRHTLQVVAAGTCASVGGSPPAGANVSASLKRGALGEFCSPAHCTTRGALAHLGVYSHCAQKYAFFSAKAGARRAGGAPPLLRTSVFGPGAVSARATAAKMHAAGSANTRAAGAGGARGGVESWRRGGRFTFFEFCSLYAVRSSVPLLGV